MRRRGRSQPVRTKLVLLATLLVAWSGGACDLPGGEVAGAAESGAGGPSAGAGADAQTDDAGPEADESTPSGPEAVTITTDLELTREALVEGATSSALALADGRVLYLDAAGAMQLVDAQGQQAIAVPPPDGAGWSAPDAAVALAGGDEGEDVIVTLVDGGLVVIAGGQAVASPLAEAFVGQPISSLAATPPGVPDTLWIGTEDGISRWRGGVITPLVITGLPASSPLLAASAGEPGAAHAVWVASEDTLYRLGEEDGGSLTLLTAATETAIDGLAVDGSGAVWLRDPEGALRCRAADGSWRTMVLLDPVLRVLAHPAASGVWLLTEGGGIVQHDAGLFRAPTEALVVDDPRGLAAARDGSVLLAGPDGLVRLSAGRIIRLGGLDDGDALRGPTTLELDASFAAAAGSIELAVDTTPLSPEPGAAAPWRFPLDPWSLDEGEHELTATITYDDGAAPAEASWRFMALPPPGFASDVGPLYEARCSFCHNEGAQTLFPLTTADDWRAGVDTILAAVGSGLMPKDPYPKLTAEQIETIRLWRLADFPE